MKALFVPFAPSLAHVSRCLAVAEAWRARGHTAVFAVGEERKALVERAGFAAHLVPEVPGAAFRADQGFRWLTADYIRRNLAAERAILADVAPDVVVYDFRFTTSLAARLSGRPVVSIVHGNAIRLALQPRETARLLLGDSGALRGIAALRGRLMGRLFPAGFQFIFRRVARRFQAIQQAHGAVPVNSPFTLLLGDESIVADIPALLPAEMPAHAHVVGPLMWSGWEQPAPWLDELDARPLVYVTMGSTVEATTTLVKVIDALRDAPYHVVVSTGSLALPVGFQVPAHVHVFPTVPGGSVARRSSLILHHGGHETLMQALAAGVPSLVSPANPDQVLVAQQVQALGIGRSLWRPNGLPLGASTLSKMTPAQVRLEVDSLVADADCARICQAFSSQIAAYRGAETAVEVLGDIVRRSTC